MAVGQVKQKGKVGVMIVGHREYWPHSQDSGKASSPRARTFRGSWSAAAWKSFAGTRKMGRR